MRESPGDPASHCQVYRFISWLGAKIPQMHNTAKKKRKKKKGKLWTKAEYYSFQNFTMKCSWQTLKKVEINKINITEMKAKHEVVKGRTDIEENRTKETEVNKRTQDETRSFRTRERKFKTPKTALDSLKI